MEMEINSVSSSNEAYLQKLLAQRAQSKSSTAVDNSTDSGSANTVDSAAQATTNYDTLELSRNSAGNANKVLLESDEGNYDSVDLSDEAQQYLDTQTTTAQTTTAQATTAQQSTPVQPKAASSTSKTENSGSTDSTEDLSLYTKEQLKNLLSEGEITQADYNTEIARRDTAAAQKETLEQENQ